MRILLSGSTGFIGAHLYRFLRASGHQVVRLMRRDSPRQDDQIVWHPETGQIEKEEFEDFDAVIHLSGKNIASGRWTAKRKEEIFLSRVRDSWLLAQVLLRLYRPPKIVLSASAIGIYGNREKEKLTEKSLPGKGFLPDVCQKWEASMHSLEERAIRLVSMRFGLVLSFAGGMLQKMWPLFRLGLGARLGSGEQIVSWIALEDLLGAVIHILEKEELTGPVNIVSPNPVSQYTFAKTVAKIAHRPLFLRLPQPLLKLFLGDMAKELFFSSAHVVPEKLLQSGYSFKYPTLDRFFVPS